MVARIDELIGRCLSDIVNPEHVSELRFCGWELYTLQLRLSEDDQSASVPQLVAKQRPNLLCIGCG
jgi:hypothetical protein